MELLRDFEDTLSRLIENQEALNAISEKENFIFEKEALLKTQESLKAHVFFLTDIYPKQRARIKGSYMQKQALILKFSYFKKICKIDINLPFESKVHLRKRRFKKITSI